MTSYGGPLQAQIPAVKEPVGLSRTDGKRPDGATLIPWARGNAPAWDVTVADSFALSHVGDTSILAGAAAKHAASLKISKCSNIAVANILSLLPSKLEAPGKYKTANSSKNCEKESLYASRIQKKHNIYFNNCLWPSNGVTRSPF